jgi:hypothetical protein
MRRRPISWGRRERCPGGSAPAVRARASHGPGAGGPSNGSCASSVCTPFAATSAAIGSGASASAGARTLRAVRDGHGGWEGETDTNASALGKELLT